MSEPSPTDSDRNRALELLEGFRQRLLPGVLRRIAAWKAIPTPQLAQLRDDVVQELFVDCLTHAREVVRLAPRDRHARWMQVAERTLYRLRRHLRRSQPLVDEPFGVAEANATDDVDLPALIPLHNGRANVAASARRAGLGRRQLRQQLDQLAAQLGWDDDRRRFWQARAAEALIGLAADLLRHNNSVYELEPPAGPDLARRRERLRRLAQRFPVQPSTLAVRRALQPWLRRTTRRPPEAAEMLLSAVALAPDRAAGWLWLFEARCALGDAAAAAAATCRARRCPDVERASLVLARARLLELRGRMADAVRLVQRAQRRRDPDRRLRRALAAATS